MNRDYILVFYWIFMGATIVRDCTQDNRIKALEHPQCKLPAKDE